MDMDKAVLLPWVQRETPRPAQKQAFEHLQLVIISFFLWL